MNSRYALIAPLLLAALLFLPSAPAQAAQKQKDRNIVLTLPAEAVLVSLKKTLPLAIPTMNDQLQGQIVLESLDRLDIHDNILSLHGVLSGKNLNVLTNIAGQNIRLRLGEVQLPITCDLQTRFDGKSGTLFVTPRFIDNSAAVNGQEASLTPLLGALGNREYPVDLAALQLMNIQVGSKSIPLAMDPVNVIGADNSLIFHLKPRIDAQP